MPKKTARKKSAKSVKPKKQKSFLSRFLTFPVIAIVAFAALSTFTLYRVAQPSTGVLGDTVATSSTVKYKLKMTMFAINRKSNSSCLAKTFKIKVTDSKSVSTTYTVVGNSDCSKVALPVITLRGNCNTITYDKSSLANWSLFEIKYADSKKDPGYVYNSNKVKVCFYPSTEGLSVPSEVFVDFGMKAK